MNKYQVQLCLLLKFKSELLKQNLSSLVWLGLCLCSQASIDHPTITFIERSIRVFLRLLMN